MNLVSFGSTGTFSSTLALGTANFGNRWGHGADEDTSRAILESYVDAGGNHVDTADVYQAGESEEIIGRLLNGRRNDFLLATKYTSGAGPDTNRLSLGNSRRAMVASVEASLRRLDTDRIDLLWVHQPDGLTPAEEILRGLDDLARAGKIIYAGLSNFPAWAVARAATLAEITRSLPIAAVQFEYSLVNRWAEAELIPAARALGLARLGWSPLGGGLLSGKYRRGETGRAEAFGGKVFQAENNQQRTETLNLVLEVAEQIGATPDQVAIAWVAAKGVLPLIGPRNLEQATSNLGAAKVVLSNEQLAALDAVSAPPTSPAARAASE